MKIGDFLWDFCMQRRALEDWVHRKSEMISCWVTIKSEIWRNVTWWEWLYFPIGRSYIHIPHLAAIGFFKEKVSVIATGLILHTMLFCSDRWVPRILIYSVPEGICICSSFRYKRLLFYWARVNDMQASGIELWGNACLLFTARSVLGLYYRKMIAYGKLKSFAEYICVYMREPPIVQWSGFIIIEAKRKLS